jgi:DNA-binding MarR family transcriptional regulator
MGAAEQLHAQLDEGAARPLVARIREQLTSLDADVAAAYHGGAAVALGYGAGAKGWTALCADLFADVTMLRPTPAARLERVLELRRQELSTRAIGDALGVSAATVSTDLDKLRARGEQLPDNVRSLDDKRRGGANSGRRAAPVPAPARLVPVELALTELMRTALEHVAGCGDAGATLYDVADALRWREGRTSSLLHRLERAGLVRRLEGRRGSCRPYVATLG